MRKQADVARHNALALKEQIVVDVLDAMAGFIESDLDRGLYVFARTL
jgi:hypothetical protein